MFDDVVDFTFKNLRREPTIGEITIYLSAFNILPTLKNALEKFVEENRNAISSRNYNSENLLVDLYINRDHEAVLSKLFSCKWAKFNASCECGSVKELVEKIRESQGSQSVFRL